jgi:hypothetical protein
MTGISPSQNNRPNYNHKHANRPASPHAGRGASEKSREMQESAATNGHDPAEVRAVLAHMLANPPFDKSAQLSNFLRYVVEEALAGRGGRIKAYTIATAALGRDENFDPQSDPIVRVEAARLRRALRSYYANGGADDAIVVDLPTGTYAPVFRPIHPQRRSAATRLRETAGELKVFVRENRLLLMAVLIIAAAVCLIFEIIDALIFDAK